MPYCKLFISYIADNSFTNVARVVTSSQLHKFIFALKLSSDEESFIAMDAFCHN